MRRRLTAWATLCGLVIAAQLLGDATRPSLAKTPSAPAVAALPMFAYYYQWFDPSSWNRAKIDHPLLGRYSSENPQIMRQHIQQAKAAGITGFIVSWKDTPIDTRRLRTLAEVAGTEHFSLAMIYQGLDFNRHPLPISKVAADFVTFRDQFSTNRVFYRTGGKALTIWSGTWAYSHSDVANVTSAVRSTMLVLSTEKSVAGYRRIADVTDGDAYYWSSVNPTTDPTYGTKLEEMGATVHADGKYWIAPLAPGFDARLVGGKSNVARDNGATLRTEYSSAIHSAPDALGLISWNEFSENTYVEPSQHYGHRYLDVLADLRGATAPSAAADSSGALPGAKSGPNRLNIVLLSVFLAALVLVLVLARRRRRRKEGPQVTAPASPPTTRPLVRTGGNDDGRSNSAARPRGP